MLKKIFKKKKGCKSEGLPPQHEKGLAKASCMPHVGWAAFKHTNPQGFCKAKEATDRES